MAAFATGSGDGTMKGIRLSILVSLALVAAVICSGCTQSADSASGQNVTPTGGDAAQSGLPQNAHPSGTPPEGGFDRMNGTPPEGGFDRMNGTRPGMDLASASQQLGVSEEALEAALNVTDGGMPDFAAAAAELGVTEDALRTALGIPTGGPPGGNATPPR